MQEKKDVLVVQFSYKISYPVFKTLEIFCLCNDFWQLTVFVSILLYKVSKLFTAAVTVDANTKVYFLYHSKRSSENFASFNENFICLFFFDFGIVFTDIKNICF